MPEPPGKRSWLVVIFWIVVALLLAVAVASVPVGIHFQEELARFSNTWGNLASVAGLWFGLIAFLLTILTLLLTNQAERDARARIEQAAAEAKKAVEEARRGTQEAVRKMGAFLVDRESEDLSRLVGELRRATQAKQWPWAVERCQEAKRLSIRLAENPRLLGGEIINLRSAAEDLQIILAFIEDNRGPKKRPDLDLPAEKRQVLDTIWANLESIRARLINELFGGIE